METTPSPMNCVCNRAYSATKCGCAIKSNTNFYQSACACVDIDKDYFSIGSNCKEGEVPFQENLDGGWPIMAYTCNKQLSPSQTVADCPSLPPNATGTIIAEEDPVWGKLCKIKCAKERGRSTCPGVMSGTSPGDQQCSPSSHGTGDEALRCFGDGSVIPNPYPDISSFWYTIHAGKNGWSDDSQNPWQQTAQKSTEPCKHGTPSDYQDCLKCISDNWGATCVRPDGKSCNWLDPDATCPDPDPQNGCRYQPPMNGIKHINENSIIQYCKYGIRGPTS